MTDKERIQLLKTEATLLFRKIRRVEIDFGRSASETARHIHDAATTTQSIIEKLTYALNALKEP